MSENPTDVYLKNTRATVTRERVWEKITEAIGQIKSLSGNAFFQKADYYVEEARSRVAEFLNSKSREVYFTSGAVESNSISVLGAPQAMEGKGNLIFVGSTEPYTILKPTKYLKKNGFRVLEIPVNDKGIYENDFLTERLTIDATFVSASKVNRETGARQDISTISKIAKQVSAVVHTDASFGLTEPLNVSKLGVDLLTIGGEYVGSVIGSGILFVREGTLLEPIKVGKKFSKDKKSEFDSMINAIAMAEALQEISDGKNETKKKLARLRAVLDKELKKESIDLNFISDEECFGGIMCVTTKDYLDSESIVERLSMKGVYVYTAVETVSDDEKSASHVLINMERTDRELLSAFTIEFGWNTTEEDVRLLPKHFQKF